jgi:ATP-dependent protease ClpP protease subunit
MPNWKKILEEVKTRGSTYDIIRRKYLSKLNRKTKRNTIAYYSGWLQKTGEKFSVHLDDGDKNGFMNAIYRLDCDKGLDLILHTPGGDAAATESIVNYLRSKFGTNIRAIVPQIAMSAGTMIACACKSIMMGKHSSLGPIDPQIAGVAAHGVVEEFKRALEEVKRNQSAMHIWQPIIARYHPTLVGECEKAINWSNEMVQEWLETGMFANEKNARSKAAKVTKALKELGDHALTKSHSRHLDIERCQDMGLIVEPLEEDPEIQDSVLSVHHAMMQTFASTPAVKIIENHNGDAYINALPGTLLQMP